MVANVKSAHKFLMYTRFLKMVLNVGTAIKMLYHVMPLREKVFSNMRSGFTRVYMPLSVAMLCASSNLCACPSITSEAQFAPVHTLELSSSALPPSTHEEQSTLTVDDLLQLVQSLLTYINGLDQELAMTNQKVQKLEHVVEELGVHLTDSKDVGSDNSSKHGGIWLMQ